jgi:hypothetical protein
MLAPEHANILHKETTIRIDFLHSGKNSMVTRFSLNMLLNLKFLRSYLLLSVSSMS